MGIQYGAVVHGRRVDKDVASSIEAGVIDGQPVVALVAVQGDLATPSLEGVKGAFARLARVGEGAAGALTRAAPPPPYASGVAVVLLAGDVAHVAATGGARCYRERDGVLAELASGVHAVAAGDGLVAASHAGLRGGAAFFAAEIAAVGEAEFRKDRLDAALAAALAPYAELVGVAAARVD